MFEQDFFHRLGVILHLLVSDKGKPALFLYLSQRPGPFAIDLFLDAGVGTLLSAPNGQYIESTETTGTPTWPAGWLRI